MSDIMDKNINWSPNIWREYPMKQIPTYNDEKELAEVEAELATQPPLVFAGEIKNLKEQFAAASRGEKFILQGGNCAESFKEHQADIIRDFLKVFMQMSIIISYVGGKQVVKVGRIAGQFAKPRSSPVEMQNNEELPSYRGDIINGATFCAKSRAADPKRQLKAYRQSAASLNLLRALAKGGYADLHNIHKWTLNWVEGTAKNMLDSSPNSEKVLERYRDAATDIQKALRFMLSCGINNENTRAIKEIDFYTSHEALLLGYEEAFVRVSSLDAKYYATSAHMLWIGDRTRDPNEAHVAFCKGIENPIGIKCGPNLPDSQCLELLNTLNPNNEEGKIALICRFGEDKVQHYLPILIDVVKKNNKNVLWMCDPMHGNTVSNKHGIKTRDFSKIIGEVQKFFEITKAHKVIPGGIHVEMTGKNVTECRGGINPVLDEQLSSDAYDTLCDPRLNVEQSLELSFIIADFLSQFEEDKQSLR